MQIDREKGLRLMSKGAYAHGTLPGMRELVKVVDENKALQGEVQRLRSALVSAEQALRIFSSYGEPPTNLQDVYAQIDEALSSSPDTGDTRRSRTD